MFKNLKKQIEDKFKSFSTPLFTVLTFRDEIWEKYLEGFTEETRQGNNCNCCKSFIRQYGNIVTIIDNNIVSIWDIDHSDIDEEYVQSIKNLQQYIHSSEINDVFRAEQVKLGTDKNFDPKNNSYWNHFYLETPRNYVTTNIDTIKAAFRDDKNVFKRGLDELTRDAIDTVLELISQNSLYRGKESEEALKIFSEQKKIYDELPLNKKDNFCWITSAKVGQAISRIRGSAIGTLLIDLSEGKSLDGSVASFENKMSGTNYKRPTALVTSGMIDAAKKKIQELGYEDSLNRRYAVETDLSVKDVLYVDRSSTLSDIFGDMKKDVTVNPKSLSKVEEVSIENFIKNILPTAKSIDVLLENSHLNNMVSLIAPQIPDAKNMFKWNNNFSWSYTGGITDSIKERVKEAGGRVDGVLRISLSWSNYDDLDLHVYEPTGTHINFRSKISYKTGGTLDVDQNAGSGKTRTPVENIIYINEAKLEQGEYSVKVNQYAKRETIDSGYTVEIEWKGEVYTFDRKISPSTSGTDDVVKFNYTRANGFTIKDGVSNVVSKEKWKVKTNQFTKLKMLTYSPNFWENAVGNRHYMFILDDCVSDETARPFFNEFLKDELTENRKVFEILASKLVIPPSDNQLSGVGFSETQRNHLFARVNGNFSRIVKVNF